MTSQPIAHSDAQPVRRALLSVSDKTGLVEAARALVELGVELISTGGTRAAIAAADLPVRDVAELTGFPEMMDGRVKTLHPAVHGGLLAKRDEPSHVATMAEQGIGGIDLLYVTLYPFEATVESGADFAACVEQIDIGGPAMIRSAAKNHAHVTVCTRAEDLHRVIAALREGGGTSTDLRRELASRAFARTAAYDAAIADWFGRETGARETRTIVGRLRERLRYGENPHQSAALYAQGTPGPSLVAARRVQGKPLGYNNIADADAALDLAAEFDAAASAAVVIVKHANPCGVALAKDLETAYARALECDPVSAYGGIIAVNRPLDAAAAARIVTLFTEVVVAPDADEAALALFAKRRNLRLLLTGSMPDARAAGETFRSVRGGYLVQSADRARLTAGDLRIVTKRAPTGREVEDMLFAFTIAKHVKSNAIVFAKDGRTAGIGAGQMNRRDSARIAALRALESAHLAGQSISFAEGSACASDAFFPFADGLIQAAEAGATAVIQPGGSIRDEEVIAAADAAGVAMAFTGVRAFRH